MTVSCFWQEETIEQTWQRKRSCVNENGMS